MQKIQFDGIRLIPDNESSLQAAYGVTEFTWADLDHNGTLDFIANKKEGDNYVFSIFYGIYFFKYNVFGVDYPIKRIFRFSISIKVKFLFIFSIISLIFSSLVSLSATISATK